MDRPIRLPVSNKPMTEANGHADVWMTQSMADSLYALLMWCKGVSDTGKGDPPGYFETLMFYRSSLARADWKPNENS